MKLFALLLLFWCCFVIVIEATVHGIEFDQPTLWTYCMATNSNKQDDFYYYIGIDV